MVKVNVSVPQNRLHKLSPFHSQPSQTSTSSDSHSIYRPLFSSHLTGNTFGFHYIHQPARIVWGKIAAYWTEHPKDVKILYGHNARFLNVTANGEILQSLGFKWLTRRQEKTLKPEILLNTIYKLYLHHRKHSGSPLQRPII